MRRWSSNLLCGLAGVLRGGSLLIFLLAMGIWVRSYFVSELIIRTSAATDWNGQVSAMGAVQYTLHCGRGAIAMGRVHFEVPGRLGNPLGWTLDESKPAVGVNQPVR